MTPGLLLAASLLAAATTTPHKSLPTTAAGWRDAARADLLGVHDILRDNSPAMLVERDSAHFRQWLDEGLAQALDSLPKVSDFRGYYYVMQGYVVGFHDSHIAFGAVGWSINLNVIAWPGFAVGWRDGGYQVTYRSPEAGDAPPPGARLVGCDGKSADALTKSHDRYDGDLELLSWRYVSAPWLLMDFGDPFVTRPNACTFEAPGGRQTFRLSWNAPVVAELKEATAHSVAEQKHRDLDLQAWDRGWWISVPSMTGDLGWTHFYADVKAHLDEIRSGPVVVIDVRGDGGGDSAFGDRLARLLWGDAMVDARRPDLGPVVWRASRLNRDSWAALTASVTANPQYGEDVREGMRRILARYDEALARGEPSFIEDDETPSIRPEAGPDLMRGRVVVLTDHDCVSACLDFLDEALAMPGVIQAGTTTSADTIFMELTRVPQLPSGLAQLFFPHKAWIQRPRGSNVAYAPSQRFSWMGDPGDDAGMRRWLAQALAEN